MLLDLPPSVNALEKLLKTEHAIVLAAPANAQDEAGAVDGFKKFLHELSDRPARFAAIEKFASDGARVILENDEQFYDDEMRAAILRLADLCSRWADRFEDLFIPEGHPISIALSQWVAPANDAVRSLQRCLRPIARRLRQRVAEEVAEDEEADAWVDGGGLARLRTLVREL